MKSILYLFVRLHFRIFRRKPIPAFSRQINSILLGLNAGIGDALMATPLVQALKTAYPYATIDLIVNRATASVFESSPAATRLWFLNDSGLRHFFKLIVQLRRSRYDLYIGSIPSNTVRQILIPYFAKIACMIKHRSPHSGSRNYDFLFDFIMEISYEKHRVDCNLELLTFLKINPKPTGPLISLSETAKRRAEAMLTARGVDPSGVVAIGFHPGCSPKALLKRWAPENYAKLMDNLAGKYSAQIIIVGGSDELKDVDEIEALLKHKPMNFCGKCSLQETAAIISHCKFFISNDSGIMHLATAVGVPTFAIFGPKDDRHVGPYGPKNTIIRNGSDVNSVTVGQVMEVLVTSNYGLKRLES